MTEEEQAIAEAVERARLLMALGWQMACPRTDVLDARALIALHDRCEALAVRMEEAEAALLDEMRVCQRHELAAEHATACVAALEGALREIVAIAEAPSSPFVWKSYSMQQRARAALATEKQHG